MALLLPMPFPCSAPRQRGEDGGHTPARPGLSEPTTLLSPRAVARPLLIIPCGRDRATQPLCINVQKREGEGDGFHVAAAEWEQEAWADPAPPLLSLHHRPARGAGRAASTSTTQHVFYSKNFSIQGSTCQVLNSSLTDHCCILCFTVS